MKTLKRILIATFILMMILPCCLAEEATAYETLEEGSRGVAVVGLQKYLAGLGYLEGNTDGIYGKKTAAAVSAFQKAEGLEETGIADSATQALLYSKELPLTTEELLVQSLKISNSHTIKLDAVRTFEKEASFTEPGPGHWFVDNGERETLAVMLYFDMFETISVSESLFDVTYIAYNADADEYLLCYKAFEAGKDCWVLYPADAESVECFIADAQDDAAIEVLYAEGGFEYAPLNGDNVMALVMSLS